MSSPQLQNSVTEFEFSHEEYQQLQVEFWSKFYACCLQYQEALSMPLGLTVSQHTGMVCLLKKVKVPLQLPFCRTIREELKLNLCLRKDA